MAASAEQIRTHGIRTWDDLIGRSNRAKLGAIRNAFLAGDLRRKLLLVGCFGFGKTVLARYLIAVAFCLHRKAANDIPCWECSHCYRIRPDANGAGEFSFWEIDCQGMSAEKARDHRDAFEEIPDERQSSVFLDELGGASEAALATFKKFLDSYEGLVVAATTTEELRNIPGPIRERFQVIELSAPSAGELAAHLTSKCAEWEIDADGLILEEVVKASRGSFRRSLRMVAEAANQDDRILTRQHIALH